jgi:threonine dehydratase
LIADRDRIAETERLIRVYIRRTPILEVSPSDFGIPGDFRLTLKLEQLQHSGSFKARGAFSNLLTRNIPKAGIVAASGGNHGAAVAFAAQRLGIPARIFVPAIASPAKVTRIEGYGAKIVIGGANYSEALAASRQWAEQSGALEIHAYDAPETICGAGTIATEFAEQAPGLNTLLVGVGGGGLIAGIASWHEGRTRVVAVEPEGAPTLNAALTAGAPVDVKVVGVAADSLGATRVGANVFPIARRFVAQSLLVTDEAIRTAQRQLWEGARIVAEPGAAAAFAALVSGTYKPGAGERVGVFVCGANTTAVDFSH